MPFTRKLNVIFDMAGLLAWASLIAFPSHPMMRQWQKYQQREWEKKSENEVIH
jgi:hypothetical protein